MLPGSSPPASKASGDLFGLADFCGRSPKVSANTGGKRDNRRASGPALAPNNLDSRSGFGGMACAEQPADSPRSSCLSLVLETGVPIYTGLGRSGHRPGVSLYDFVPAAVCKASNSVPG
eukprot:3029454-Rhodomonas_salina.3